MMFRRRAHREVGALALLGCATLLLASGRVAGAQVSDWPTYGHDSGGQRYSPLSQINTTNVAQLKDAWTYHMRPAVAAATAAAAMPIVPNAAEAAQRAAEGAAPVFRRRGAGSRFNASQTTALVINGMMVISTPYQRVVALDPANGKELWVYAVPGTGQPSLRGVEYWPGDKVTAPRIVFGTRDGKLIALDAKTGTPAAGFGNNGVVDMVTPEIMPPGLPTSPFGQYGMTSPPTVYKNLVITGAAVQESPAQGAAGDIRAWDVRTGKLVWTFHTVPRAGEFGNDTWKGDSWRNRSGVNVWGFITVDAQRGIAYLPIGAPSWDRYGGDRLGDNLFSSSIVAVDANTGRRLWHFQLVHHDIWDWDAESPPLLLDVKRSGRTVPAVAVVSKIGMYYLFNRVTGEPLLPVEERPVPASDAPGEVAAPTQPFSNTVFARQSFTMADVATVTPELESYCRQWIESNKMRMGRPFEPVGSVLTIGFPGRQGGANWGGGSYHPELGLFFVNADNLGHVELIRKTDDGRISNADPASGRFSDRDQKLMCQQPPWGTLTAIDANTGKIVWQSALGVSDILPADKQRTGRPNVGGSIATAGGLVFIGATDDGRFRAFDARTGAELWTVKLAASAHATPITYQLKGGKQYVAVVGTGGSFLDSPIDSDELRVFALP
jgi:quinoprotein glucose dehydrogenase